VPSTCPTIVCSGWSVSESLVARATPKSMTFGTGRSSTIETSTLEGFRSRWMMPFWCACWIASQTSRNSSTRLRVPSSCASQNSWIGRPGTYSIAKYGRPFSARPPS